MEIQEIVKGQLDEALEKFERFKEFYRVVVEEKSGSFLVDDIRNIYACFSDMKKDIIMYCSILQYTSPEDFKEEYTEKVKEIISYEKSKQYLNLKYGYMNKDGKKMYV